MTAQTLDLGDIRILELPAEGPPVRDATELISLAWEHQVSWISIPAERLGDAFFKLSSGVAGELAQKLINYRLHLAIVGDLSSHLANSSALRSWVYESNRGDHLWFVESREALAARLSAQTPAKNRRFT